jgi:chromosome segregation ATPase
MNQKNPPTDTITKKDVTLILDSIHELKKELKKDVKELREDVKELKKDVKELREDVKELREDVKELREDVKELREDVKELREDFEKYRNENMERLDQVMAEFQNIREDNVIGTYQIRELRENVDDHEKRITKIEKKHIN